MSRPNTVRSVKHRTWGSGTRLLEELPIPLPLYHAGRGLSWGWRRRVELGTLGLALIFWGRTGSFVLGVLLAVIVVAGCLTGWIWWSRPREARPRSVREALVELRRRRALTRQWPLACEAGGLLGPRRAGPPRLYKVTGTPDGGLRATCAPGRIGVPVSSLLKATSTISDVVGCRDVIVTQVAPGVAQVDFHWSDPVGRDLPLTQLPLAPRGQLAYGVRPDGSPATIRAGQSVLIGGLTRSGKSSLTWALLADLVRQRVPVRLYVSDPKGGVELDALEARMGAEGLLQVRCYATTPKATTDMIGQVEEAMHCRQRAMKDRGERVHRPTVEDPLVILLLDETLPLVDMLKRGTDSPLGRIAYTGAACGYVVWACSQVAQVDSIGRFRDLIPQRICLATPTPQVTDSVLGQGSESNGAACSAIRSPGVGYSYADSDSRAIKFRAARVTDDQTRQVAAGKLPRGMITAQGQETALYRWWDADDNLLYVGITNSVGRRTEQHEDKPWWGDVARSDVEWFPTRDAALAAEKAAIRAEMPLHNKAHSLRRLTAAS